MQGFFATLLARGAVAAADPCRGRFRAFLLTAFRRHAADERDRDAAAKRGGGTRPLSLDVDFAAGESRLAREPSHDASPEREFERRWAMEVLSAALGRTREEFEATERGDVFRALVPFVGGAGDAAPYAEIAARLGRSEDAVKVAVHRLRGRYREHLRAALRDTVSDAAAVDDEIRDLLAAVAAR